MLYQSTVFSPKGRNQNKSSSFPHNIRSIFARFWTGLGENPEKIMSSINGGRRCAACKYLRRRCSEDCILAPYFHPSNPYRFSCVHKIFGASNIARMLKHLPAHKRAQAADAMAWEACWRVQDPVYGSNAIIAHLQHEIRKAQNDLEMTRAQIAILQNSQHQKQIQTQPIEAYHEGPYWAPEDEAFPLPDLPFRASDFS